MSTEREVIKMLVEALEEIKDASIFDAADICDKALAAAARSLPELNPMNENKTKSVIERGYKITDQDLIEEDSMPVEIIDRLKLANAALELEVMRLREALNTLIAEHEECEDADGWMAQVCSMEAIHVADEVIDTPLSPTALREFAIKIERATIERCLKRGGEINPIYGASCALDAIRALPVGEIKLEDFLQ